MEKRPQLITVRVINRAFAERLAGTREFAAGAEDRDTEAAVNAEIRAAGRRRDTEIRGRKLIARVQNRFACREVASRKADVRSRLHRSLEDHRAVLVLFNELLLHDGIRSGRHLSARENAGSGAGFKLCADGTRGDPLRHRERHRVLGGGRSEIRRADRVAIHLGVIRRRHVHR